MATTAVKTPTKGTGMVEFSLNTTGEWSATSGKKKESGQGTILVRVQCLLDRIALNLRPHPIPVPPPTYPHLCVIQGNGHLVVMVEGKQTPILIWEGPFEFGFTSGDPFHLDFRSAGIPDR